MAVDLPPPQVETVVVRPARLPPAAGEAAFSIVQIGPEQLTATPRLDDVLTDVPGVSLFRRTSSLGANPTTQGISLRAIAGSGASRALVTLDGVPQHDPFGGWVIWSAIPPETIEQVRIVRGAGAGPYGAGALTGTIALEETAALGGGVKGELSYGSLDQARGSAATEFASGGTRVLLAASAQHSDGWIPIEEGRRGAADTALALDAMSATGRIQTELGRGVVALRGTVFREKRDGGLVYVGARSEGWATSLTWAAAPDEGQLGWRVQGWLRGSDLQNTSAAVAANRATTTPANNQYATPATGYGVNVALRGGASRFGWEIGADVRIADGEVRELSRLTGAAYTRLRIAGGKTTVGGLYAEASRTDGPWLFTGGVRLDRWSSADAFRIEQDLATNAVTLNINPASREGTVPTARVGLRRELGTEAFWRAAAYAGFRPATLNELYRPFRVGNDITESNAALEPERLYGVETGVGGQLGGAGSWSLGVFYNRLEDAIANVTIGVGPGTFPIAGFVPAGGALRQRQNTGAVKAVGVEFEAMRPVTRTLNVNVAANYTRAKVDGGVLAPQLTGLRPAQTPRFSALAGLSWRFAEPGSLRVDVRYEGERFDDDTNSRVLDDAVTFDARLDWRVNGLVGVFAAVENATDANVETAVTGDGVRSFAAPRVVRAGITLRR